MIDNELFRKLQARRKDVDLHGTTWAKEQETDSAQEPEESSPQRLRKLITTAGNSSGRGVSSSSRAPGEGSSELERKLQARRSHVDSKGDTWQKLPEASAADARISTGRASVRRSTRSKQRHSNFPDAGSDSAALSLEAVRGFTALPVDDVDRDALLDMLMLAEPWPWEDLARGSRTWVCSAWVAEPLCALCWTTELASQEASRPYPWEYGSGRARAHPAVLCLGADGEVMCCLAAPAPPGVEEEFFNQEADYARILGLFNAKQLDVIFSAPSMPQARAFHFTSVGQVAEAAVCPSSICCSEPPEHIRPTLIALFESEEDAVTFSAVVASFTENLVMQEVEPKNDLPDFTEVFAPDSPPNESPPGSPDEIQTEARPQTAQTSKAALSAFMTETKVFLQELDRLAGFA